MSCITSQCNCVHSLKPYFSAYFSFISIFSALHKKQPCTYIVSHKGPYSLILFYLKIDLKLHINSQRNSKRTTESHFVGSTKQHWKIWSRLYEDLSGVPDSLVSKELLIKYFNIVKSTKSSSIKGISRPKWTIIEVSLFIKPLPVCLNENFSGDLCRKGSHDRSVGIAFLIVMREIDVKC